MIHRVHLRLVVMVVVTLLCCGPQTAAQVQAGDDVQLSLNGSLSTAYSGSFGNEQASTHGIGFGGNANLNGSYYNPNFLSFTVSPFYNQSRSSSSFSAINDSSGVTAQANIFNGSQFPGYISYSRIYNSESNYLIPGISNFKTNGDNQTLAVGWNFHPRNLPALNVGYQQGSTDNTLYGAQSDSLSDFRSLFGNAMYSIDGFHLSGGVHHSTGSSQFPEIVAGQPLEKTNSDTTTYTFNLNRSVAWGGNSWVNVTRNSTGY